MSDGAIATDHVRGYAAHDRLSLNTPIYIGGLPINYGVSIGKGLYQLSASGASKLYIIHIVNMAFQHALVESPMNKFRQ